MSEEEKQIHLYMHSKNELGLATLCVAKNKEIERLTFESTKWESKFYDEAKKVDKAIEYIEENQEEHKYTDRGGFTYTEGHFLRDSDTLLEILDKEE